MPFVNSVEPYRKPDSNRVRLLTGLELEKPLMFDEIMGITNSPYSNENWSRLAYHVSRHSIRPYYNEHIGRIADRNIAEGEWIIDATSVNCLFYKTSLRMPSVCDWTRQFLFFTSDNFLGSLEIYALQLSTDTSEHMALRQIAKVAQYQLVSNSPFHRFMIAIQKENNWELAFGYILPTMIPSNYIRSRKVKISLFTEPSTFFHELLNGGKANNTLHDEYELRVEI